MKGLLVRLADRIEISGQLALKSDLQMAWRDKHASFQMQISGFAGRIDGGCGVR
ncbi:hypothetical protein QO034_19430 [Sedimentitalea sp. JM2-8]|uniref:Uncharacterized protein n=1 Tax=Sedimentitalea xiamensis TaxID=3050037 RepID=A0ABT7FJD9_9RHOB|nr:hypothetical protein [Sedimentitalea xiamensis]